MKLPKEVYDPRGEQQRAQVQGIYETQVRRMLDLPYDTPFRTRTGRRLDVKHKMVGPNVWGIQGRFEQKYGMRSDSTAKSRARYANADAVLRNRQDYEETLGLQRHSGFFRVTQEITREELQPFIWPMPDRIELPMRMKNMAEAQKYAALLNSDFDPRRRQAPWWKPPTAQYTRKELDYWLPPLQVFKP